MLISVVIPLYNKAATVLRAVESVRAQSWQSWELIVVDDGSSDGGAALVRQLADPRIRVLTQTNAGVSVARNLGLLQAQAEWVAFLDADDYWRPDHLARLAALVDKFPDATLLGASYGFEDERGHWRRVPIREAYLRDPSGLVEVRDFFADAVDMTYLPATASSVLLPRALSLKLGGFPAGITAGEDQLMWARLACAGRFALSVEPTAVYVEPAVSASQRAAVIRRPQRPDLVGVSLRLLLSDYPRPENLRLFLADWHRIRAVSWMELNERCLCLSDIGAAIRWGGMTKKDWICVLALLLPASLRIKLLARRRERIRASQSAVQETAP